MGLDSLGRNQFVLLVFSEVISVFIILYLLADNRALCSRQMKQIDRFMMRLLVSWKFNSGKSGPGKTNEELKSR